MKIVKYSSQFKKDIKKYRNQPNKLDKLAEILALLQKGQSIPLKYRPHKLIGDYKGCMECHVEGDFLLIWFDEDSDTILAMRVGSHSELFE